MLLEKIELEPGEDVLITVRKHWFVITMQLFSVALLFLIPFIALIVLAFLPDAQDLFSAHAEYRIILTFGISGWMLCVLLLGFNVWTHYFLDLWLVTDRRIIVIDQRAFFSRKVSSFRLERLQDIEVEIIGIIPTFLDFGTLRAETASASENDFTTSGLPHPRELQALIQGATDKRLGVLRHPVETI
jgi:hypothetical protein